MAPNQKPIANSFHDIANSPQVAGLTMEYKFGAHQILAVDTERGHFTSTISYFYNQNNTGLEIRWLQEGIW